MSVFDWAERQRLLRRLSRVARDRDQAEDLLQSAFLRLAEYSRHNVVENEAGSLVRAATNIAVDEARRARTRSERGGAMDQLLNISDERPLQDEVLLARERLSRVREAMLRLPERTREVFLLHRFAGLKYRDIAARFGITVSAVEKHVAKATLFLADWIDDERNESRPPNT
jgi:RNA polymerase sigma factor (sigma-70 family)